MRHIILSVLLVCIIGCTSNSPLDTKFSSDPASWESNEEFVSSAKKLTGENKKLLMGWMVRYTVGVCIDKRFRS